MGFDDLVKSEEDIAVSDTQAYRQFGNAVVPKVVAAVAGNALAKLDDLRRLSHGNRCALKGRSWKGEPPEANRLAGMALPSTRS